MQGSFCGVNREVKCSFCGKTLAEAKGRVIVSSTGASICVECVELCNSIIKERWPDGLDVETEVVARPKESL
jgi:ATP-dependent protease Clp ATPase subunit